MAIESADPIVLPPQPEQTFGLWWVKSLRIDAGNLNATPQVFVELQRYARDANGVGSFAPGDVTLFRIDDLWAKAATDKRVAMMVTQLINLVGRLAKEAGAIS